MEQPDVSDARSTFRTNRSFQEISTRRVSAVLRKSSRLRTDCGSRHGISSIRGSASPWCIHIPSRKFRESVMVETWLESGRAARTGKYHGLYCFRYQRRFTGPCDLIVRAFDRELIIPWAALGLIV